jgi:hypothetical protein
MPAFGPERGTACLLHNEPASYSQGQGEAFCIAVAKASLNRAIESLGVHAKRDDLRMGRMKPG